MSTPPSPHPAYQQSPGAYPQNPGPYQQAPAGYQQPPAGHPQAPGSYQQAPVGYEQAPAGYGYPQAPYPQAPGGYGQPSYPQAPGGYGQAGYQPAPGGYPNAHGAGCDVCGGAPTVEVTVRGHQGMVVIMRQLHRRGVFCRTCALAVFRKMQSDTMAQGWWGPMSMLITPVILLINLFTLAKIRKLPEPVGAPRPGLDPGRPVLARPMGIVGLFPLTGFALFVLVVFVGMAVR
ncbi:LppU/SCO3897 family protein [Streptomyces sp. NPDC001393]